MEIIGRVTRDATVTKLKDERHVVNFSIAMNDYYKPKGSSEGTRITTFVNCAYWISIKIAPQLIKGVLVELYGRMGINAYNDKSGEAKGTLTFHVNNIKLHGKSKANNEPLVIVNSNTIKEPAEDLPF